MPAQTPSKEELRRQFRIAILCCLSLEADVVERIFDSKDVDKYGKAKGDTNVYTTGTIANHRVVLTYLPSMGSNSAAQVAVALRSSFLEIEMALVVGVCGVAPFTKSGEEILLGDCMISTSLIQYDFGRQGPKGFRRKDGLDSLSRPPINIASLVNKLQTLTNRSQLIMRMQSHLKTLQMSSKTLSYAGRQQDRLFPADYDHHHVDDQKDCDRCDKETGICGRTCAELSCDERLLVQRKRLLVDASPIVHFGLVGSSNTVMKSGLKRTEHTKNDNIISFEMEGSGVWDVFPTVVIKGACDYADSHKNKVWQPYAAAVGACAVKSLLEEVELDDQEMAHETAVVSNLPVPILNEIDLAGNLKELQEIDKAIREDYTSGERQRLRIERLSGASLDLQYCYINLAIFNRTDAFAQDQAVSSFALERRLRIATTSSDKHIPLEGLFKPKTIPDGKTINPRRIFIQGRAGVGKTTLCKKIVHEFVEGRFGNDLFDRLLWVPLRRLKSNVRDPSWIDIIKAAFPHLPPRVESSLTKFAEQLREPAFLHKTLLLFDGLDEISHNWEAEYKSFGFLPHILRSAPNIIVTSRPHTENLNIGKYHLELETLGFLPEQVDLYLCQCVENEVTRNSMQKFIAQQPLLQGLLRIPIQLDAFCWTWRARERSKQESFSNMSTLYYAICIELWKKDIERLGLLSKTSDRSPNVQRVQTMKDASILKTVEAEEELLSDFAFQGLLNDLVEFTPYHQHLIVSHLDHKSESLTDSYQSVLNRSSFLRTSSENDDWTLCSYHFLHLTFQEYFAAKHFVRYWLRGNQLSCLHLTATGNSTTSILADEFVQKHKYEARYNIFWRFVVGLLQRSSETEHPQRRIQSFFDQLNSSPYDALGYVHIRLLMYAASELNNDTEEAKSLRSTIHKKLHSWTIVEYQAFPYDEFRRRWQRYLAFEMEYPLDILYEFLKDNHRGLQLVALRALSRRNVSLDAIRKPIVAILEKQSNDFELQEAAIDLLKKQSDLPTTIVGILISFLKNLDTSQSYQQHHVATRARKVLMEQSYLAPIHVDIVLSSFDAGDLRDGISTSFLTKQAAVSPKHFLSLVEKLNIGYSYASARDYHYDALVHAFRDLPTGETISTFEAILRMLQDATAYHTERFLAGLISAIQLSDDLKGWTMLEHINSELRAVALKALRYYHRQSPSKAMLDQIGTLVSDESAAVRVEAAGYLRNNDKDVALDIYTILIPALQDEDARVRQAAIDLVRQEDLNECVQEAVVSLLADPVPELRDAASRALRYSSWRNDRTHICEKAFVILNGFLAAGAPQTREIAAKIIAGRHPWPENVWKTLSELLKSTSIESRCLAMVALGYPHSLPLDILELIKIVVIEARTEMLRLLNDPIECFESRGFWLFPEANSVQKLYDDGMRVLLSLENLTLDELRSVVDWPNSPFPEERERVVMTLRYRSSHIPASSQIFADMLLKENKHSTIEYLCGILGQISLSQILIDRLREWLMDTDPQLPRFAIKICFSRKNLPRELLEQCVLTISNSDKQTLAAAVEGLHDQRKYLFGGRQSFEDVKGSASIYKSSDANSEYSLKEQVSANFTTGWLTNSSNLEISLDSGLLALLKAEEPSMRDAVIKILMSLKSGKEEIFFRSSRKASDRITPEWQSAYKDLLQHEDPAVQTMAAKFLSRASNANHDCLAALCLWWSGAGNHMRKNAITSIYDPRTLAIESLEKQSSLPSEAGHYLLNLLVALSSADISRVHEEFEYEEKRAGRDAVKICIPLIVKGLVKPNSVAQAVNKIASPEIKRELISGLVNEDVIANLLHLLDDEAQVIVCAVLITLARGAEISCYQLEDEMYLRRNGKEHKINFDAVQRRKFLDILAKTRLASGDVAAIADTPHIVSSADDQITRISELVDDDTHRNAATRSSKDPTTDGANTATFVQQKQPVPPATRISRFEKIKRSGRRLLGSRSRSSATRE